MYVRAGRPAFARPYMGVHIYIDQYVYRLQNKGCINNTHTQYTLCSKVKIDIVLAQLAGAVEYNDCTSTEG